MKQYGLNELREKYLSFFESKGHLREPSFPLVPIGDNSLLLINSGMAPLKPYFSGEVTPPSKRMTTCQKCIRTPDIEEVGKTSRHGTFFEMLGNFSFGDYFKKEACIWAWEFIIDELEMPKDKIYVTVYQDDDEAWDIWENVVGVDPTHISRLGKKDNFWEIGAGPCGPCSEIYFDRGEENGCGDPNCAPGCECDRFVEFWNNVFTQFHNDGENNYTELKHKNIDTGMGLERLACICQGVKSIFDVDTIMNITKHVSEITGASYGVKDTTDVSLRIITDHSRSTVMMISDGVLPSNEGRGYVLRRLLRRAARHGRLLGVNEPFLYQVAATVISESKGAYPELEEKRSYITKVIRVEEDNFAKTIDAGMKMLGELMETAKAAGQAIFSGAEAFKLYDTYGFPIDLTREIVEEAGMSVDRAAFDTLMLEQRQKAKAATAALGDFGWAGVDLGLDASIFTAFTGYQSEREDGCAIWVMLAENEVRDELISGNEGIIVLDRTPFYAEMGGQVADYGTITGANGVFAVTDVRKTKDGKYLHSGMVSEGSFQTGEQVSAEIDVMRRNAVKRAHSATHLLHKVLRDLLGDHVEQAGSLVEPDHLRFDFTHFQALTVTELQEVTKRLNRAVLAGYDVDVREMPIAEAKEAGAMALFGEKYGETVRVVRMGDYSVELCGGIHLDNTAKVGLVHLTSEFSVASGVRRIEAITGEATLEYMEENQRMIMTLADSMKTKPDLLRERMMSTVSELKEMRNLVQGYKSRELLGEAERFLTSAKIIGEMRLVTAVLPNLGAEQLRSIGDFLKGKSESIVAILAATGEEKITFLAVCGKEAVAKGIKAGDLIRLVSQTTGGSGGGKPESAMGGGKDAEKLDEAFAKAEGLVKEKVSP